MKPRNPSRNIQKAKVIWKKYSIDNINKAVEAIQNGMSRKLAAKTFQVPRTTLIYRLQNPQHNLRPGPSTVLTEDEEKNLEDWINVCCKKGFPKRKDDVISSVSAYLTKKKRLGRFTNGEKWFKLFLQRHPSLSFRTPEAITAASAAVTESDVRGWFKQIENYLHENDLLHVLADPSRALNGDETNFLLCPKTGVVIAPKGQKNVYEVNTAPAKTSLTVMFTFCANGHLTPPMVIFPNKRSNNGWMKSEIFHDYIETVLHPHLVKTGTQFPVILFVDGHKTHLTYAVSDLCTKLKITLIALYPNCTRLLQPADVSAFKPLKYGWQKSVLEWRRTHTAEALTKSSFVPILKSTIEKWIKPSTIINGFRATGLFPWDVNAVDLTKCLGKCSQEKLNTQNEMKIEERVLTKKRFIDLIGKNKIAELESNSRISEDNYLQKIWDFFKGNNITNTTSRQNDTTDNVITIEDLPVNISEDDLIPVSQEVEIYDDSNFLHKKINDINTDDNVCLSQNSQSISIVHSAEVYPQNNIKRPVSIRKPINIREDIVLKIDPQHDFNKIELLEDIQYLQVNPSIQLSTKILSTCTPVKLQDILVIPKTPQKKGTKNSKRAPFVLTSAEWKAQEHQKIKIKEEKAEGIRQRKEEREKMKEQKEVNKTQKKANKPKHKRQTQLKSTK